MNGKVDAGERTLSILEHMLEDAQDVATFILEAESYDSFRKDVKAQKAVIMSLLNIGELAHHLPVEYQEKYPEIPWRRMIGMRNLAAHGYHKMRLETVWETARVFIPELIKFLQTQVSVNDGFL